jgi:hypothetical protein
VVASTTRTGSFTLLAVIADQRDELAEGLF